MAPKSDFTHLTRLFEERDHLADWKALLDRATLPTVATDYAVSPALEHALVDLLGLDWEAIEGYEGFYADYQEFVRLVRHKRNVYQEQEVMQLHRLWRENGGMSGLHADMSLEDVLRRFQGDVGSLIRGGQAMVGALYTLPIDPASLNGGLTNFKLGRGQIMFLAALAVVTGKYDYSISRLPKTAQEVGTNVKALEWKGLHIDWRRGYAILRDMGDQKNWWQQFEGLEGYREFTFCYADGDMLKGFMIASALLEMQGKGQIGEVLKWQQLQIKTIQLPQLKQALDALRAKAKQENYDALGEYAFWSDKWAGGDMQKGFKIASALLEMQGKEKIGEVLKWQGLYIRTSQLPKIKQALDALRAKAKQENYDALGEYAFWSDKWAGGDMQKGCMIASALLEMQGKGKIGKLLKWQQLQIKTSELPQLKQALDALRAKAKQENYDALGEYASWSDKWAGGDMLKGFMIASALLEMQGKGKIGEVLKWHELQLKTSDLVFVAEARKQPKPPSSLAMPSRLVGVITGQSFTGLRGMLSTAPVPMTLTAVPAPKTAASARMHVFGQHVASSGVNGATLVVHSPALVRAATTLIRDQPTITDHGTEGALALAPEIEIVAPVAANDDVEHNLRVVGDTASVEADQLNPAPLAAQPLAPQLFGAAHLVTRAVGHHVLRVF